jgi:hypothetical protein
MQRMIGNQAVQRLLQQTKPDDLEARAFMEPRFGQSVSRVSVYPTSPQSYSENLVISAPHDQYEHELIRVQQQTAGGSAVLRRQPKEGEKKKADAPAAKFVNCDKDRLPVVQDAIEKAKALASRAVQAFEREYPLSYESAAMKAHFGSLGSDQKSTIIERYKKVLSSLGSKTYTCAKDNKEVKAGDQVVDLCGQASCPGNKITLFPVFGSKTCPAGPVMLHEAVHNEGGCDDINKGRGYPPSSSENNAYSYEYFALDVTAGYKTPEPGKRKPTVPKP